MTRPLPTVPVTDFRFRVRAFTGSDLPPLGSYTEEPSFLEAIAKTLHGELGLDDGDYLAGGGQVIFGRPDMPAILDVAFNVVGTKKFGPGEAVLVSAIGLHEGAVVAWTPDLDPSEPDKPDTVAYHRRNEAGPPVLAPLPVELKSTIKQWKPSKSKAASTKPSSVLCGEADAYCASFSPDGSCIAIGDSSGRVRLYDATDGQLRWSVSAGTTPAKVLAFAPDGRTLVAGTRALKELDVETGKAVGKLASHGDTIDALAISPSGARIASAGKGKLIVWDRQKAAKVYGAMIYDVDSLAFVDEDRILASNGSFGGLRRFDCTKKAPKLGPPEIEGPRRFFPVTEGWLMRHLDGRFVIHDRQSLEPIRTLDVPHTGAIFATDGADTLVVEETPHQPAALVIDVRTAKLRHRLEALSPTGVGTPMLYGFSFDADGRIAAHAGRGITIWNADGSLALAPRT